MDLKKKYSLLIGLVFTISLIASTLQLPSDVINGLKSGKAEVVSKYFRNTVELIIDNQENIYSNTQAQLILKDFFKKNPPQAFNVLHEGGKGESKYVIGSLKTTQGNFRITIFLKLNDNKPYIHQLRIEKVEV